MEKEKIKQLVERSGYPKTMAAKILFGEVSASAKSRITHRMNGRDDFTEKEIFLLARGYRERARKTWLLANEILDNYQNK